MLTAMFDYQLLSFAAPLKDIAVQLWGDEARTDRGKLQQLGMAAREIEPDTWLDMLIQRKRAYHAFNYSLPAPPSPAFVNDDCRFENEWFALKAEGFVMVRVECGLQERVSRLTANGKLTDDAQLEHRSEMAIDHLGADYTIANSGSKVALEDELIEVLLRERRRR